MLLIYWFHCKIISFIVFSDAEFSFELVLVAMFR